MDHVFKKVNFNSFTPANQETQEWSDKIKIGADVHGNLRQYRIGWKHRKYFALLNVGFQNWTPGEINSKYGRPLKNFERFRKDVAILCGYFHMVIRLDGTAKVEADSISFAKMDQVTFEDLYSKTIDLFLERIYGKDMTSEQIDNLVKKYLEFS